MAYLIHLAIIISIYAILSLSLNLVVGHTGMFSMATASFYGIGAYATAILMTHFGLNFFISILIGVLLSGTFALGIGYVLSRLGGDYFALGSLGFSMIVVGCFVNWQGMTGGATGIPGIGRPSLFGFVFSDNVSFLLLAFAIALCSYFLSEFIVSSAFGRVLKAIREDEKAIQVFGYHTRRFKMAIFAIGSMLAAVAGSLYASYLSYIDPSTFGTNESMVVMTMIILGGLASNKGAVLGATVLVLLPEALRFVGFPSEIAAQIRVAIYGLLLVLLMLYRTRGIVGASIL